MKLHKLKDFSATDTLTTLVEAASTMTPDVLTQREAFTLLMPGIRALREKKISFKQIEKVLGEVGFTLKAVTVRSYYGKLMAKGGK